MAQKNSHAAHRKSGAWKILLVLVVLLALAAGSTLLFAYNEISGNGRPGAEVTVSIPQGSGVSAIAQKLKDAGVIRSAYLFRWYVGQKGAASKLQYGDFTLLLRCYYCGFVHLRQSRDSACDHSGGDDGYCDRPEDGSCRAVQRRGLSERGQ